MNDTIILPFEFNERVRVDWTKDTGIEGIVSRYVITKEGMQVEVSWFANGDHKQDWFERWRVTRIPLLNRLISCSERGEFPLRD